MKRMLALAGGWVLLALTAHAQDYPMVAPKPVPPVAPAGQVSSRPAAPAVPDGTVLVPQLKGIVVVATPDQVVKNGVSVEGIEIRNVPVPDAGGFKALVAPYLGSAFTRGQLNELISRIVVYYRQHDRPIVDVIVPEQEITAGTIQLIVLEGYVGKITTTGNHWFSDKEILGGIRLKPGDPIRASKLQDDLDWLNANPFRGTDAIYQPGDKLGATDLVLQTRDRFPLRVYGGYEDSGTAATGFGRYEAGFNWGNVFGLSQQLNYQYTTSSDGDSLRAHSGSYVIPLPWRHTLTLFGSYTDTRGVVPPFAGIEGKSHQLSARYSVPLPTLRSGGLSYQESVAAGFDYKYNNNSLEFGGLPAGGTRYDVAQFVVSYNAALADRHGQTALDLELYYSPGNWLGDNTDAAFGTAHTLAVSGYAYGTLSLERLNRLPGQWALVLRGTFQLSSANLVPSEQLGFGGYTTIRGYDDREVNADEGVILSAELHTPALSVGRWFGHLDWKDQLQFLGFLDYGDAFNHTLLPGEPTNTHLASAGGGLRYTLSTYLSVRFDYGWQIDSIGLDNRHGARSHLGFVLSY